MKWAESNVAAAEGVASAEDVFAMRKEKTFIRFQGETLSLDNLTSLQEMKLENGKANEVVRPAAASEPSKCKAHTMSPEMEMV